MSVEQLFIVQTFTIILTIFLIAIAIKYEKELKKQEKKAKNKLTIVALLIGTFTIILNGFFIPKEIDAHRKGMRAVYYRMNNQKREAITIKTFLDNLDNTPYDESYKLSKNTKTKLILFYKYGCPDCNEIYPDVTQAVNNREIKDLIHIPVASKLGKTLTKKYKITNVPTFVFIKNDQTFQKYPVDKTRNPRTNINKVLKTLKGLQESN